MQKIFFYLLVDPDKPSKTKVGITKNLQTRIKAYKTSAPGAYFMKSYTIPDKKHEKRIIELLKDRFRVHSEFVHCHPQMVQNIVESYLDDNGIAYQ